LTAPFHPWTMPDFRERKGSQLVEATMVLPLTILVMMVLIGLIMTFFSDLQAQLEEHETLYAEQYLKNEVQTIRIRDRLRDDGKEVMEG